MARAAVLLVAGFEPATSCKTGRGTPAVGSDEFPYKFGWLRGTGNLFTGKNN